MFPFENNDERIAKLNKRIYAPRPKPTIIPSARWDECPLFCIAVNDEWLSHIIGALDVLDQADTWKGTFEQIQDARNQVRELIAAFMGDDPMNCCCGDSDSTPTQPILHRINPDTLQLEISNDGGLTWYPDPDSPIADIIAQPPPVTSGVSETKCDAATNGKQHIEDIIAGTSDNLDTAISVFDFAVAVAGIILAIVIALITGGAGAPAAITIAGVIWGAASAAFNLGKTAFDDYWTTDERDKILCALYCHIGDDGSFDDSGYGAFLADWKSRSTPSVAFNMIYSSVTATGIVGLNNMCSYGNAADADCSACNCDCDPANWDATVGTIIDPLHEGYITVQSELIDDSGLMRQWAVLETGNNDLCCQVLDVIYERDGVSHDPFSQLRKDCGSDEIGSFPVGACVHWVASRLHESDSATPFTMSVLFGACPEE